MTIHYLAPTQRARTEFERISDRLFMRNVLARLPRAAELLASKPDQLVR